MLTDTEDVGRRRSLGRARAAGARRTKAGLSSVHEGHDDPDHGPEGSPDRRPVRLRARTDPTEWLSARREPVPATPRPFPEVGGAFVTQFHRPILTFARRHVARACTTCSTRRAHRRCTAAAGVEGHHPSCRENFELAARQRRACRSSPVPEPVNLFQNTPPDADGRARDRAGRVGAGRLRAVAWPRWIWCSILHRVQLRPRRRQRRRVHRAAHRARRPAPRRRHPGLRSARRAPPAVLTRRG